MRKHTIIAYTLHEGDTLYYLDRNEVKSITLSAEHVKQNIDRGTIPLEILDGLVIQPGIKVQQKRNGQLVLWEAYLSSSGVGMGYSEHVDYYPTDSRLFVDKELFDKYVEKKLKH